MEDKHIYIFGDLKRRKITTNDYIPTRQTPPPAPVPETHGRHQIPMPAASASESVSSAWSTVDPVASPGNQENARIYDHKINFTCST
uniref:Uncharacterized protein n=1 Tax=Oryza sativa subsp. japonica TaxID=39947 RepID=Q6K1P0_ORYSJ|nr:hypothetical protein [Oryza sativa Japonica Group]